MNVSTVRVTWQWNSSGPAPNCFLTTTVTHRPEGGSESSLQLSDPAANGTTLTGLQCNTNYTMIVVVTAGEYSREGVAFLPLQGIPNICKTHILWLHDVYPSGPQNLSAAVLSPTSVQLTWVAPCHTQQYHIYYRGVCGTYINESSFDTVHQEHTFNGLQESINYTFIVS